MEERGSGWHSGGGKGSTHHWLTRDFLISECCGPSSDLADRKRRKEEKKEDRRIRKISPIKQKQAIKKERREKE